MKLTLGDQTFQRLFCGECFIGWIMFVPLIGGAAQ